MSDDDPDTIRRDILYFDHDRPNDPGVAEVLRINRDEELSDAIGFHPDDPKVVA